MTNLSFKILAAFIELFEEAIVITDKLGEILLQNKQADKISCLLQKEIIPIINFTGLAKTRANLIDRDFPIANTIYKIRGALVDIKGEILPVLIISHKENTVNDDINIPDVLNSWLELSNDGFYIANGKGNTKRINKVYQKMSGYNPSDLVDKNMEDLVRDGYFGPSAIMKVLEEKKQVTMISKMKNGNDTIATATPIFDTKGNIHAVVSMLRDISEYQKLQDQYKKLQDELDNTRELNEHLLYQVQSSSSSSNNIIRGPRMQGVFRYARQVAPYPTPIYLTGESGVGKEVVATYIKTHSLRSDKEFIKVNCAAIPEHLLESELFGYEAGAFTGAHKNGKPGLFELANEGTLLLDEIGDLAMNLQVKLLRVIQEGEITRLGGIKPQKLDVRIISATNKDLAELVAEGKFRKDLFFRLNVIRIEVPPLRERKEEIIPLAQVFLQSLCVKYNLQKVLSSDCKESLLRYDWPGNIRELQNLIENMAVSARGCVIDQSDLPVIYKKTFQEKACKYTKVTPLKEALENLERTMIRDALRQAGTVRGAAKILEVDHSTLSRKIQRLRVK